MTSEATVITSYVLGKHLTKPSHLPSFQVLSDAFPELLPVPFYSWMHRCKMTGDNEIIIVDLIYNQLPQDSRIGKNTPRNYVDIKYCKTFYKIA